MRAPYSNKSFGLVLYLLSHLAFVDACIFPTARGECSWILGWEGCIIYKIILIQDLNRALNKKSVQNSEIQNYWINGDNRASVFAVRIQNFRKAIQVTTDNLNPI